MNRSALYCIATFSLVATAGLLAQQTATTPVTNIGDYFSSATLAGMDPQLREKAQAAKDGLGTIPLKRYPGDMMNLMLRTQSGMGEMHANWSDILIALAGEADVITGGTLVDRTDGKNGESRGSRSEGGIHHIMHKGDVLHIAPRTPHWTVLPAGATFTFLAIKIANPATPAKDTDSSAANNQPR